ncbi:DUF4916 domain-containing protein [Helcobacillus massiliensis]|uniref:DUF4916 domain-containing protein n=1 Tax=Helcobacillus massiliensis TaxID=521392 RepID=UPI002955D9EA|nr:DUF4916 domain-containing protein [Helcobacillus massiliensis]WOO93548.1 DUF4916 domain-containing protein [Helcobacillus massiliensis]
MTRTAVGTESAWFDRDELEYLRSRLPILYVDIIPVRQDASGAITEVGLLLRADGGGHIVRSIVSGRVLVRETLRDAIMRHVEKDLGSMSFPKIPTSITPMTVAEYFPTDGPDVLFHNPRQHAVSMVYVVPVEGECEPQEDALELSWFSVAELREGRVLEDLEKGHRILVQRALANAGLA